MNEEEMAKKMIMDVGGEVDAGSVMRLPDGSGCFTASFPLPKNHWLTADGYNVPPMPLRIGEGPERSAMADKVRAAAKYAIRASTMNGKEEDFDPDAMVQNMVVGLLGYWTADGLSSDSWANPSIPEQTEPLAEAGGTDKPSQGLGLGLPVGHKGQE